MRVSNFALAVAFCVCLATPAAANEIAGKWSGMLRVNNLPQPFWLDIKSTQPGKRDAARLSFSRPRNCYIKFEYGGFLDGVHVFYYEDASGFCYKHGVNGQLLVKTTSNGNLSYELKRGSELVEGGIGQPAN